METKKFVVTLEDMWAGYNEVAEACGSDVDAYGMIASRHCGICQSAMRLGEVHPSVISGSRIVRCEFSGISYWPGENAIALMKIFDDAMLATEQDEDGFDIEVIPDEHFFHESMLHNFAGPVEIEFFPFNGEVLNPYL